MKEFIFCNRSRINMCVLPTDSTIDMDIGVDNDYSLSIPYKDYEPDNHIHGGYFYRLGSELGGLLNIQSSDTNDDTVLFTGKTFRGMLSDLYTEPASGQDYLKVSGELNSCIRSMCGSSFLGGLFKVSTTNTGVNVSNHQVNRYDSYLDAITDLLSTFGYKLKLEAKEEQINDYVRFYIELSAKPIIDHSDEIENSQDGNVGFKITKAEYNQYNYMLCLGQGELKNRTVVKLKLNSNGTVTKVSSIPDALSTRVYKFDYPSAESESALIQEAKKQWNEIMSLNSQSINLNDDMTVDLHDIVGGRDYITGIYIKEQINRVIFKYEDNKESYSYKIGEDT